MKEKIKYYLGGGGWKFIPLIILLSPILILISPALIYSWLKDDHKKIAEFVQSVCVIYMTLYVLYIVSINLHYIMATMLKYLYFSLAALVIVCVYILEKSSSKN